jgi:hypothetical protein
MPIRLRLAIAFAVVAAALYALGSWAFASGLSSAQLSLKFPPGMGRRSG